MNRHERRWAAKLQRRSLPSNADKPLFFSLDKIDVDQINPEIGYSGQLVLELVQKVKEQERERLKVIHNAGLAFDRTVNDIVALITCAGSVFRVVRAGENFKSYVKADRLHDRLSGQVNTYRNVIGDMRKAGIMTIPDDDPTKVIFEKMTDEFLYALDLVDKNQDNGSEIGRWIETYGPNWSETFTIQFRSLVNRGGRPVGRGSPVVDALRRCAYELHEEHGTDWAKIRDLLWRNLTSRRQDNPLAGDEKIVYNDWKNIGQESRRKMVETAFR